MLLLYIVSFKEFGSLVCLWHDVKLRKTQLEVRSLTATWSRDLWGHRVVVFLEMCQIVGWTAMANLAALRAAVFSLSAKNLRGGGWNQPPPPVRGSNCCMRRPAKFHVDSAVRLWAISNILEGGASNAPPPPVKRGLKPIPGLYFHPIKSYKQKRILTSWCHYLSSNDLSGGHICKVAPRSSTVA